MSEVKFKGEILDTVWKLEKIAVDFHGGKISWPQFRKIFTNYLLELMGILINFHLLKVKKGG